MIVYCVDDAESDLYLEYFKTKNRGTQAVGRATPTSVGDTPCRLAFAPPAGILMHRAAHCGKGTQDMINGTMHHGETTGRAVGNEGFVQTLAKLPARELLPKKLRRKPRRKIGDQLTAAK